MTIEEQCRIVRRVRCDLTKEAHKHRENANKVTATDCEEQAAALKEVEVTLGGLIAVSQLVPKLFPTQAGGGK